MGTTRWEDSEPSKGTAPTTTGMSCPASRASLSTAVTRSGRRWSASGPSWGGTVANVPRVSRVRLGEAKKNEEPAS